MWAEILAIYAAVVSTGSLAVAYFSYRSGGPQLSGSAEIYGRYDIEGPTLHINIHNRGRGAITVDSAALWGILIYPNKSLPTIEWPLHLSSDALPCRIEGHSGTRWHVPAHEIARYWLNWRNHNKRLEVQIGLANGGSLVLKVDTANIDVLDGHNLPDWQPDYFKDHQKPHPWP